MMVSAYNVSNRFSAEAHLLQSLGTNAITISGLNSSDQDCSPEKSNTS